MIELHKHYMAGNDKEEYQMELAERIGSGVNRCSSFAKGALEP